MATEALCRCGIYLSEYGQTVDWNRVWHSIALTLYRHNVRQYKLVWEIIFPRTLAEDNSRSRPFTSSA